jgi:hypothetical protein
VDRALVLMNLSTLDLFAEEVGLAPAQDLAMRMVDAVRSHVGPVYVVDQKWPMNDPNSRPRANFRRMVELARDIHWVHYDENNKTWEIFLRDLIFELHEDGVGTVMLGGVWFDPAGKVGAVAEAYHAMTGNFQTAIDTDLVGEIPPDHRGNYAMSGARMGAVEGWVVTQDGETIKAGFKRDFEAAEWLLGRVPYSIDHAVTFEGYDIVLVHNGKIEHSYRQEILKGREPVEDADTKKTRLLFMNLEGHAWWDAMVQVYQKLGVERFRGWLLHELAAWVRRVKVIEMLAWNDHNSEWNLHQDEIVRDRRLPDGEPVTPELVAESMIQMIEGNLPAKKGIESELDLATNFFGRLAPEYRKMLRAVVENPTQETWEHAYTIILSKDVGMGLTLWQAVIAVDPSFPKVGPASTYKWGRTGKTVKRGKWKKIPTRETLIAAIKYATH